MLWCPYCIRQSIYKSDHFPIVVVLEKMPKANVKVDKASGWNIVKPGGWSTYNAVLEEAAEELEKIVEDKTLSEDEVVKRFDATTTKMKFKAFGKTKPVSKKSV